jgi:hypothetical protein
LTALTSRPAGSGDGRIKDWQEGLREPAPVRARQTNGSRGRGVRGRNTPAARARRKHSRRRGTMPCGELVCRSIHFTFSRSIGRDCFVHESHAPAAFSIPFAFDTDPEHRHLRVLGVRRHAPFTLTYECPQQRKLLSRPRPLDSCESNCPDRDNPMPVVLYGHSCAAAAKPPARAAFLQLVED